MKAWDDRFYEKYGEKANLCCPRCACGTLRIFVPPEGSTDPQVFHCTQCDLQWTDNDPLDIETPEGYEVVPFYDD